MRVNKNFHPLYLETKPHIQMLRDSIKGSEAIKAMGDKYLSCPAAMDGHQREYDSYLGWAEYLPVVPRTLSGLLGRTFSNEPEFSEDLNVDALKRGSGRMLRAFMREVLAVGFVGILADADESGKGVLHAYRREDILDWHFGPNGLEYVKLREDEEFLTEDYSRDVSEGFRIYGIRDGRVFSQRFEVSGVELVAGEIQEPRSATGPLQEIPFTFVGEIDGKSVISDLCELALHYYELTAQYKWALAKVAAPTFVIEWDKDTDLAQAKEFLTMGGSADGSIAIGASHALQLLGATARFVEVSGAGLAHIRDCLSEIKSSMIAAGARALADQSTANLAAETARIVNSGEASQLSEVVGGFQEDMNRALAHVAIFDGGQPGTIKMSKEFFNEAVSAQDIVSLVGAWQSGGLPDEMLFESYRRGGWTNLSDDELRDRIQGNAVP